MAQIYQPAAPVKTDEGKKGGGKTGQLLGALGGAAIGAGMIASGGLTAPIAAGALGATTGGASLGGLLGEAVSPSRQGSVTQEALPPPVQEPDQGTIANRMAQIEQSNVFQLKQAKAALQGMSQDLRKHYEPYIDEAMRAAMHQSKMGVA